MDFVPNREQLSELGHTQLVTDIGTVGTLIRLYAKLGYRYPRLSPGYWTKDKLLAVIKPLCQELRHVPTHEMMAEQLG